MTYVMLGGSHIDQGLGPTHNKFLISGWGGISFIVISVLWVLLHWNSQVELGKCSTFGFEEEVTNCDVLGCSSSVNFFP